MRFLHVLSIAAFTQAAAAQTSTTYATPEGSAVAVHWTVVISGTGDVGGSLVLRGESYPFRGVLQNGSVTGTVNIGRQDLYLDGLLEGDRAVVTLMDVDRAGRPRTATAERFELWLQTGQQGGLLPAEPPRSGPRDRRLPGPMQYPALPYALDPMLGRFSDGYIHLDLFGANGRYEGTMTIGGTPHPVRLSSGPGTEYYGGVWIQDVETPVVVAVVANGVSVTLDAQLRVLPRVSQASGYGAFLPPGGGRLGPTHMVFPGQLPFHSDYLVEWFNGKALYFPDPLARTNAYGVVSRRILHLCYGNQLIAEEQNALQPAAPTADRRSGYRNMQAQEGTWQLTWDDLVIEVEIMLAGRTERFELTLDQQDIRANGERVLVGYSERCR